MEERQSADVSLIVLWRMILGGYAGRPGEASARWITCSELHKYYENSSEGSSL